MQKFFGITTMLLGFCFSFIIFEESVFNFRDSSIGIIERILGFLLALFIIKVAWNHKKIYSVFDPLAEGRALNVSRFFIGMGFSIALLGIIFGVAVSILQTNGGLVLIPLVLFVFPACIVLYLIGIVSLLIARRGQSLRTFFGLFNPVG